MYKSLVPGSISAPLWSLNWHWEGTATWNKVAFPPRWEANKVVPPTPTVEMPVAAWPTWPDVGHAGRTRDC